MAEETQYTANTGFTTISTANSNLDGTGTLGTLLTAGANGTLIKSVSVIPTGSNSQGIVRLFIYDGTNNRLFKEIEMAAVTDSDKNRRYEVHLDLDFSLKSGYVLKASTELADAFAVIAEGLDWAYYTTSVRADTTQYTANTGLAVLSTKDVGVAVLTAGGNGCSIESITIKAQESPNEGLIDIYIADGIGGYALYGEIKVDATTRSGIASSYEYNYVFENDFELKAGYILAMVTRQSQLFSVVAEGLNWTYPV